MNLGNVWSNEAKCLRIHAIGDGMQPGWQRKAFDANMHFLPKRESDQRKLFAVCGKKAFCGEACSGQPESLPIN